MKGEKLRWGSEFSKNKISDSKNFKHILKKNIVKYRKLLNTFFFEMYHFLILSAPRAPLNFDLFSQ